MKDNNQLAELKRRYKQGETRWHLDDIALLLSLLDSQAAAATSSPTPADNEPESLLLSQAVATCTQLAEHVTQELTENSDHPQRDILNYDDYRKGQIQAALEIRDELQKLAKGGR